MYRTDLEKYVEYKVFMNEIKDWNGQKNWRKRFREGTLPSFFKSAKNNIFFLVITTNRNIS